MRKVINRGDYYMTNEEIARTLGISKQRVQQIVDRAIEKLRDLNINLEDYFN